MCEHDGDPSTECEAPPCSQSGCSEEAEGLVVSVSAGRMIPYCEEHGRLIMQLLSAAPQN